MAQAEMTQAIEALKITLDATFIPYSQSRNKAENWESLNWKVTVKANGRVLVTTDYGQGVAHCPAHGNSAFGLRTLQRRKAIEHEIENGTIALRVSDFGPDYRVTAGKPIAPPALGEVLYSLVSDAQVLDYASFDDWASDYGYDVDSRKAEKLYRACLDIALKLRSGLGEDSLRMLQDAAQDY